MFWGKRKSYFSNYDEGLENGVFLYPGGTGEFRDIICLGPAFTIGDEEIELMVNAVRNSLNFIADKYS